jgi:hypothetical protein
MCCPSNKNEDPHKLLHIDLLDQKMMKSRACDDTLVKIKGPLQGHVLGRDLQVIGLRSRVPHGSYMYPSGAVL